jgi:hypothetical protein
VDDQTICIVVDTNILQVHALTSKNQLQYLIRYHRLQHLGLLQQFVRDVERAALSILVIIPGAVLNELDG